MTLSVGHAQRVKDGSKPLLYNIISDSEPALSREGAKAYAGKYQVVTISPREGFSPGGIKGLYRFSFKDPRSMREWEKPGKVSYAFIIRPDGRVIEPRILQSTDEGVSKYIIEKISYNRYFPARFHDTPIYSLRVDKWEFGGPDTSSRASGDGLGVYHGRDR